MFKHSDYTIFREIIKYETVECLIRRKCTYR